MPLLPRLPTLAYGGDYNPEQWPPTVWREDVSLMAEAGVTLVTVGVFAWAWLEPAEGRYEFAVLDEVVDLLHDHGIAVDLATATASPPPWFSHAYPQTLPVDADGRRLSAGSRQAYCPSSPVYREAAARLAEQLALRYGSHPALALWHVNNEYGCHVAHCYCDVSAAAFRTWLRRRYGDDLDALNAAWGTAFWSQRYTDWEQVIPPRATPTFGNPTQTLDFRRFTSDELLDCYRAERDVLRRITPGVPVTTNLMAGAFWAADYWAWARELDVVSTDHYLHADLGATATTAGVTPTTDLAFAADLTRSLAGGRPWLLMEHSTSAVNWQPRNLAKTPGQLRRNSLAHVARGSDGAMFFQWRASVAGAEKFHSAMVPHTGTGTRIWREVVELGGALRALAEVAGAEVERPEVALLLDWSSVWAGELPAHPSTDLDPVAELKAWHAALYRAGLPVDLAQPAADLSPYRLVVAPSLYLLGDAGVANLRRYVDAGGCLVVGPFTGVVDEHDHVRPGRLDDLLGVRVEEFHPLPGGGTANLDDGGLGRVWTELAHLAGAAAEVGYADNPDGYPDSALAGSPVLTRHGYGQGQAWYLTTLPDPATLDRWVARFLKAADVTPTGWTGVEAVRRRQPSGQSYLFLINHGADDVDGPGTGTDLLTGVTAGGTVRVPARGAVVLRENGAVLPRGNRDDTGRKEVA
ncbi:beta-galactosidase [Planosporangium sp. 12N6]|uniref:beta-galactosidase n=1 Tax=Planosporangium spinosum TaxID=3402278 RepID=UPI003CF9682B